MAVISFENYVIDKSIYIINDKFEDGDENGNLRIPVNFSAEVGIDRGQKKAYVIINLELGNGGDEENIKYIPFTCEVSIRGIYGYSSEDLASDDELKAFLGGNAVAILYPYLRSYVSTLTNLSNQFPPYTLPVMNFAETIRENNLITFVGFD